MTDGQTSLADHGGTGQTTLLEIDEDQDDEGGDGD